MPPRNEIPPAIVYWRSANFNSRDETGYAPSSPPGILVANYQGRAASVTIASACVEIAACGSTSFPDVILSHCRINEISWSYGVTAVVSLGCRSKWNKAGSPETAIEEQRVDIFPSSGKRPFGEILEISSPIQLP